MPSLKEFIVSRIKDLPAFTMLASAALFLHAAPSEAQSPGITGYAGTSQAILSSFCETADGGTIAAGYIQGTSTGPESTTYDALVVKFDASGNMEWQKSYGKEGNDFAFAITPADDGGYVVAGETYSFGAIQDDVLVFRIDNAGGLVWAKRLGGTDEDWGVDVKRSANGGFVVLGNTRAGGTAEASSTYKLLLIGLDSRGELLWQKSYGGSGDDLAYSLTRTKESEFIVTGATGSFGGGGVNGVVMKTDAGGIIKWQKYFATQGDDYLFCATEASDGGYLVAGESFLEGKSTESNAWLVRLSETGGDEWQKAYGFGMNDYAMGVTNSGKHGFIIVGGTSTSSVFQESWAMKLDWSGKVKWKKSYDLTGNDILYSVRSLDNGGFQAVGAFSAAEAASPFIVVSDKSGSPGSSCDAAKDSQISRKWISAGSGLTGYVPSDPALTSSGIKSSVTVTTVTLAGETVCGDN